MRHLRRNFLFQTVLVAVAVVWSYSLLGETQRRFYPIPDDAELSNPTILCLAKDSRNFLWIGTQDGLNRYDGYRCKQYRWEREGGLRISYINDVEEDPDGNLWICSHEGLFRFDSESEEIAYAFGEGSPLQKTHGDMVTRIDFDSAGMMWVGSYYGLLHWNPKTDDYKLYTNDPDNPFSIPDGWESIRSMCLQNENTLWVGSFSGLMILDIPSGRFEKFALDDLGLKTTKWSQIFDIRIDQNGIAWISTQSNGLIAIDSETRKGLPFNQTSIYKQLCNYAVYGTTEDADGRIWIATDQGLQCYDPVRDEMESYIHDLTNPYSIGEDIISTAPLIDDDILWLPTRYAGVWSTDLKPTIFTPFSAVQGEELNHSIVSSFAEDGKGNLIIATDGGGINVVRLSDWKFSYYRKGDPPFFLPSDKTLAVIVDSKGRYWIGTWNEGLLRYDPDTGERKLYRNMANNPSSLSGAAIFHILEDREGQIWVATWDGGISRYVEEKDQFFNYIHDPENPDSIVEAPFTYMMQDREGNIWIASEISGLCCLYPDTGEIRVYKHVPGGNSINSNSINCIWEDPKGLIYIGTNAGGLNILDPGTGKFLDNPLNGGIPCSSVYGIESDPYGMVWLSTNNGLFRYNRETSELNGYTKNDGIHDNRFGRWAFSRLASGDLLFGGPNGFTLIHSDGANLEEVFPDPKITEVWMNDRFYTSCIRNNAEVGGSGNSGLAVFPSDVRSLKVAFSAPWFRGNDRIRFQYKLEGIDQNWVSVYDSRIAQYRNLSHGSYKFKVRVSNLAGKWSDKIVSFPFVIRTPWELRWYSKLLFLLLGIAMIMMLIRWRVYQYRKRGIELEKRIQERTSDLNKSNYLLSEKKEEIEAQNKKLTQLNLTKDKMLSIFAHDIKNPFNAVLSLSEILHSNYEELSDKERKEYIEFVRITSNNIYELLDNLLFWSISQERKLPYRPEFVWIDEVFEPAFKLYEVIAAQKNISLETDIQGHSRKVWADSQLITMVFRNLLNNAIKFTPIDGRISIRSRENEKEVVFWISDTGTGMTDEQASRVFKQSVSNQIAVNKDTEGTGLGLPLCREIIELHGGKIHKDPEYTDGMRICFTVPFEPVNQAKSAS